MSRGKAARHLSYPAARLSWLALTGVLVRGQIGTDIPVHSIQQNTSATAVCTESIACDDTYARIAPGVVGINCVDPATKTSGLCTGEPHRLLVTPLSDPPLTARRVQGA